MQQQGATNKPANCKASARSCKPCASAKTIHCICFNLILIDFHKVFSTDAENPADAQDDDRDGADNDPRDGEENEGEHIQVPVAEVGIQFVCTRGIGGIDAVNPDTACGKQERVED